MAAPTVSNTNLANTTRDLWLPSAQPETVEKNPLLARLILDGQVEENERGEGTYIKKTVTYGDAADLAEWYGMNDPLGAGSETFTDALHVTWNYIHSSTTIPANVYHQNQGGSQMVDLAGNIVERIQQGLKIKLRRGLYDVSDTSSLDSGEKPQSVCRALDHGDDTADPGYSYLGLTRDLSTETNDWFQSADLSTDFFRSDTKTSTQDDSQTASIKLFRQAYSAVKRNTEDEDARKYMVLVGPDLYRKFQSAVGAYDANTNVGPMARAYGFTTFSIDGVEFVEDGTLMANTNEYSSHDGGGPGNWLFLFYIPSWMFFKHPDRSFTLEGPYWQAEQEGGYDRFLWRSLLTCATACFKPNQNMWLTNVS